MTVSCTSCKNIQMSRCEQKSNLPKTCALLVRSPSPSKTRSYSWASLQNSTLRGPQAIQHYAWASTPTSASFQHICNLIHLAYKSFASTSLMPQLTRCAHSNRKLHTLLQSVPKHSCRRCATTFAPSIRSLCSFSMPSVATSETQHRYTHVRLSSGTRPMPSRSIRISAPIHSNPFCALPAKAPSCCAVLQTQAVPSFSLN